MIKNKPAYPVNIVLIYKLFTSGGIRKLWQLNLYLVDCIDYQRDILTGEVTDPTIKVSGYPLF